MSHPAYFALRPGHVVFLGHYYAWEITKDVSWTPSFRTLEHRRVFRMGPLGSDEARAMLTEAHPAFSTAPMQCLTCTESPQRAPADMSPSLPDDDEADPDSTGGIE